MFDKIIYNLWYILVLKCVHKILETNMVLELKFHMYEANRHYLI